MFPFRRRKLGNAAAAELPQIRPIENTITHNYSSSRFWTIIAIFVVAVASAILFWHGLVFLLGEAGYKRPTQAAAECLIGAGILFMILTFIGLAARYILRDFYAHRETQAAYLVELERARYSSVQLIPATTQARMTREESRKYLTIKMVMARAYELIDPDGNLTGSIEPWSRRQVGMIKLLNEHEELGEHSNISKWVKPYLLERHILLGDRKVNLADFPNLASVETQLVKDFGQPIIYNATDDAAGMSTQYLNKGSGSGGSWAS